MTILRIKNLHKKLSGSFSINITELSLEAKEKVLLLGENGSGKSSLLRIIAGIWKYSQGEIMRNYDKHSYLPTDFEMIPSVKVATIWKTWEANIKNRDLYETFDINEIAKLPYGSLSDGQKQRLRLALVLSQETDLFLLDEPATSLDKNYTNLLVEHINASQKTFLIATHNQYLVQKLTARRITIKNGKI